MCDSNSALSLQGKELHVDVDALHLENDLTRQPTKFLRGDHMTTF